MAVIAVRNFVGEIPRASSQLLPDSAATIARDVKLERGNLRAWKDATLITTPDKTGVKQTIYRFGETTGSDAQYWFTWTTDVDVVRAPVPGTTERTYFTGDGPPKKTDAALATSGTLNSYPTNAYLLGIPMPDTAASVAVVSGTATDATSLPKLAAYVVTYVSSWGEEGAPGADAIGPVEYRDGQTITLDLLPAAPTGNYNITAKRIYRSATGNAASAYQFVAEIPVANTSYADTKHDDALGETLATAGWYPPPDNGFGLTMGQSGCAIMFVGKTIYPCEPYALYAYPDAYHQNVESDIVGGGAIEQGFVVLTKAHPYILFGNDPASMMLRRMDQNQACVSKRSIVEMNNGVVYASPDGLYAVDATGVHALTKKLLSKEDWTALKPESIHAYELDGRYMAFYDNGVEKGCLTFDFGETPFITRSAQHCTAAYNDPMRDSLYMAQGANITKWDSGAALPYLWRSKDNVTNNAIYAFARVQAASYPVTLRVYYDGTLVHTQSVASASPFRLPPVRAVNTCAFEVEGTAVVHSVAIATSVQELRQV